MQNQDINRILKEGSPAAIGKIGFSEMKVLYSALTKVKLTIQDYHDIFVVAGVFPPIFESIFDFVQEMKITLLDMDVLAVMELDPYREKEVTTSLASQASLVKLRDLEPYYWKTPWSSQLEGKKVLVISPFINTIQEQYQKRKDIWKNNILPNMELSFIQVPLSNYLKPSKFNSWVDTLADMKHQMSNLDFDVCLVGAGAWSLPLAAEAKRLGKIGIHLGGPLQILFGIKGRRWDEHDVISKMYNEHWVRPSRLESPGRNHIVEGGCYW